MSDSPRRQYLQTKINDLDAEEQRLLDRLAQVRAQRRQVQETLDRDESPTPRGRNAVPVERWRRTVREMGTFTISELAAELECTRTTAKKHLDEMIAREMVAPAGRVLGKPVYEYTKPTDAGEAFVRQQERRATMPPPPLVVVPDEAPARGTVAGISKHSVSSGLNNKVVRAAVQDAERRGWSFKRKGDGHFVLVKGARRVPVASTPKNPDGTADIIRRMTREQPRATSA